MDATWYILPVLKIITIQIIQPEVAFPQCSCIDSKADEAA
jgi:hypothetical protein